MTKKDYTHVIVHKSLHRKLKQLAKNEHTSISKLIENLLFNAGINTSINTQHHSNGFPLLHASLKQPHLQGVELNRLVRLPGFEPGLGAWGAPVLDQARPQPHRNHQRILLFVIEHLLF
jgi:hypothetical protein